MSDRDKDATIASLRKENALLLAKVKIRELEDKIAALEQQVANPMPSQRVQDMIGQLVSEISRRGQGELRNLSALASSLYNRGLLADADPTDKKIAEQSLDLFRLVGDKEESLWFWYTQLERVVNSGKASGLEDWFRLGQDRLNELKTIKMPQPKMSGDGFYD